MKRVSLFLLGSTILVSASFSELCAKTYRANHGVAFQSYKNKETGVQDISPAAGDEVFDESVENGKEKKSPLSGVIEEDAAPKHDAVNAKPTPSEALPNVVQKGIPEGAETMPISMGLAENCEMSAKGILRGFYYSDAAKIKKLRSSLVMETNAGAIQHDGHLYGLKRVSILTSTAGAYPLQIMFTHEFQESELLVFVPVVAGAVPNPLVEFLLHENNNAVVDLTGLIPSSMAYSGGCSQSAITLEEPVSMSASQIDAIKNL